MAINKHPDVRRMLMNQKVLVETMRSFIYTVAHQIDTYLHTDDPTQAQSEGADRPHDTNREVVLL